MNNDTGKAISVSELKQMLLKDEVFTLLDTRSRQDFTDGFIPGSIYIGLDGGYKDWMLELLPKEEKIFLICTPGTEEQTLLTLQNIPIPNISGFISGGFEAWKAAGEDCDLLINVEVDELHMDLPFDDHLLLMDVRREDEFDNGHLKDAVNVPLSKMTDPASMAMIEDTDNIYVSCQSGYRSVIAGSLLKRQGIHNLRNVLGGWLAMKDFPGLEIEKTPKDDNIEKE